MSAFLHHFNLAAANHLGQPGHSLLAAAMLVERHIERECIIDHFPARATEAVAGIVRDGLVPELVPKLLNHGIKEDAAHVVNSFFVYNSEVRSN